MNTEIIVAIITSVASVLIALFSSKHAAEKTGNSVSDTVKQRLEVSQAVTDTKIEELTREVREHNTFARRMPVVEEQIKVINHRIDDLENERS